MKRRRPVQVKKSLNIKSILTLTAAFVLVAALSIGGTLAWLQDETETVTNTFTPSGIKITLTEKGNQEDGSWKAQMIPGEEYEKNPVVAVDGDQTNVDVYLFVKFEETVDENVLTYTSTLNEDNGWQLVNGQTNVWWREVKTTDDVKEWHLLEDDKVTVANTVVESNMPTGNTTMVYTAYAIQTAGFEDDVAGAWTAASAQANP